MSNRAEIVFKYFPGFSIDQQEKILKLEKIYGEQNKKVNLISRNDIGNLYEHHVLHSLAIAKFISFPAGSKIMDAGTGGGFPGIPLAILFPDAWFTLVDSIRKKTDAVKRISEELQLKNVICLYNRIEEAEGKFDFIVSRALAEVKQVLKWTKGKCKAAEGNGYIFLKGGDVREELTHSGKRNFKVVSLRQYFSESYFETKKLIWLPFLPE